MAFIKVSWIHDLADEPVTLYSEITDDRYEIRKVEVFRDGSMTYADENEETGRTWLGESPVPAIEEIAAQSEFVPESIEQKEFERVWNEARFGALH